MFRCAGATVIGPLQVILPFVAVGSGTGHCPLFLELDFGF